MLSSIITKIISKMLLIISIFYSFFLLFNGENIPGGGFIAAVLVVDYLLLFHLILKTKYNHLIKNFLLSSIYFFLFLILLIQFYSVFIFNIFFVEYIIIYMNKIGLIITSTLLFDICIYIIVISCLLLIGLNMFE